MNNNKLIIITTALFLLVSFVFLSVVEKKQADISALNVWMVYFENPKDNSLDFDIENHSVSTNFHWQILSDKDVIKEGDATISNGVTKKIPASVAEAGNKKITVKVTSENNSKEIYKILQ